MRKILSLLMFTLLIFANISLVLANETKIKEEGSNKKWYIKVIKKKLDYFINKWVNLFWWWISIKKVSYDISYSFDYSVETDYLGFWNTGICFSSRPKWKSSIPDSRRWLEINLIKRWWWWSGDENLWSRKIFINNWEQKVSWWWNSLWEGSYKIKLEKAYDQQWFWDDYAKLYSC